MTSRFFKKQTGFDDEDSGSTTDLEEGSDTESPKVKTFEHPEADSSGNLYSQEDPSSDPVPLLETDPSSTPFPTTLADLHLNQDPTTAPPSLYKTLRSLRRATLSIPNRLTSILSDSHFVTSVSQYYQLPLIANERCGSWYIPSSHRYPHPHPDNGPASVPGGGSVYFKSTDGHHFQWSFSLRRLNLQLLKVLGEKGGAVVVDSTRRGKKMSDALAKSIPIWVAVVNKVLFPGEEWRRWWRVQLPETVGESERAQIESRVEGWCEGFRGLGLDLEGLRRECGRPIRVLWAVNGEWEENAAAETETDENVNLLVLCSASRRVVGAEVSEGGYIQGAGDDNESWSRGLTSEMFWERKDILLDTAEEDLPDLIDRLLQITEREEQQSDTVLLKPTRSIFLGVGTRILNEGFDLVINCNGDSGSTASEVLDLKCRDGKLGSRDLREKLVTASDAAAKSLQHDAMCRVLITCSTGRDLSVGVAVVLLCQFFDEAGELRLGPASCVVDKALVKKRLVWVTAVRPDANPSRSTLQAVNSFLMQKPL